MAINSNIALGVQPLQLADPLAQYSKVAAIQGAQQQNELARQQMAEYERARVEDAELRNYLAQSDLTKPEARAGLTKFGKTGLAYSKALTEQDTAKLTQQKTAFEVQRAKKDFVAQAQRDTSQNPSDANITAFKEDLIANPLFTEAEKQQMIAGADRILSMPMDQRQAFMASQGATANELRPQAVAPGGSLVQGGKAIYTAPEATDPEVKRYEYARDKQGYKGTLFDFKREMAMAGRTPAQPAAPTITQVIDPANPNQMLVVDARRYQGGGTGSPGVIGVGGKEPGAALRTNKAEEGKTQLANDLDNLRSSFAELDRLRAIPSTERGVVSNLMSATQSSGIGQALGRAGGTKEQVERDVINSARLRLVSSIKNATGMSSKSLDSNVELQTMLRSLSDPSQSVDAALRIIDDIEAAYVKGNGTLPKQGDKKPPAGANVVVTPDGQSHTFPTPAAAAQFKKAAGIP